MTGFDADQTARALLALREQRSPVERLDPDFGPRSEAEGAAAQRALARRVGADKPAGFKIGATARIMQKYLGLAGPAAGFMASDGVHLSGARIPYASLVRPGVECEVAVRLARDLPPGPCTPERAAASVEGLMAGIEVVENRYGPLDVLGSPTLVADQVFHAGAVLGAPHSEWRGLDLRSLAGSVSVNGHERGAGTGADLLGDPMSALAWLAASEEAAAFGGLRAGQVVMLQRLPAGLAGWPGGGHGAVFPAANRYFVTRVDL